MEKKNNNYLVILLVIFIFITIILGGYLVYNKLNNEPTKEYNDTHITNKSEISVVDFYFNSIAIVSEGSVYVNVYGSALDVENLFGKEAYNTLVTTRNNKYKKYSFDNFHYILNDNKEFVGMKLNTNNVKKVYTYNYGQVLSKNYGLILLNEDKSLSIISLYSLINGKTDVKNISELFNIENIITENNIDGIYTYAVNQNGDKINLNSYIPKDYNQF